MSGPDDPPGEAGGRGRLMAEPPAELGDMAVRFDVVAASARRDHVVPGVLSTAAARNDVVDAGGGGSAVRAPAAVTGEQGSTGERDAAPKGHADELGELDDTGRGQRLCLAVQIGARFLEAHGLVVEHEDERAAERYDAERLVRRVQDQHMWHGCLL